MTPRFLAFIVVMATIAPIAWARDTEDRMRLEFASAKLEEIDRHRKWGRVWIDNGRVQIPTGGRLEAMFADVMLRLGHDCEGVVFGHMIDRGDRIDAEISCRAGKFALTDVTIGG